MANYQELNHREVLQLIYDEAFECVSNSDDSTTLSEELKENIDYLIQHAERNRGVYTVFLTLVVQKLIDPEQDIRYHQAQLEGGFAGRIKDATYVTPFLRDMGFPAMSSSGWLTRSLEQPHPYTLDYPGKITPIASKEAFLKCVDHVQCKGADSHEVVLYMLKLLIKQRNSHDIQIAKPHGLSIANIIKILEKHFTARYSSFGASRLPTLAIYAAYQCMMAEVSRFNGKVLCPLESHTSADSQSGQIGDVQVNYPDGNAFEGIEVKHKIPITVDLIRLAYQKFMIFRTNRYYLLTTANMDSADWESINREIDSIAHTHGCQVIVNGVYSTLKYYLRLLNDPAEFIDHYVELLKSDDSIKYEQQKAWNDIVSHI